MLHEFTSNLSGSFLQPSIEPLIQAGLAHKVNQQQQIPKTKTPFAWEEKGQDKGLADLLV